VDSLAKKNSWLLCIQERVGFFWLSIWYECLCSNDLSIEAVFVNIGALRHGQFLHFFSKQPRQVIRCVRTRERVRGGGERDSSSAFRKRWEGVGLGEPSWRHSNCREEQGLSRSHRPIWEGVWGASQIMPWAAFLCWTSSCSQDRNFLRCNDYYHNDIPFNDIKFKRHFAYWH